MEIFDGFISAVASEFKIRFHKDDEGNYTTNIEFEGGRSQEILITLTKDESGDRIINYYSVVGKLKKTSASSTSTAFSRIPPSTTVPLHS